MMLAFAAMVVPGFLGASHAHATSEFTYQGQLNSSGAPYSGTADLQFRLFTSAGGTTQIGPTLNSSNVNVVDGRFTVLLNFLNEVPVGGHIEVSVRTPHDPVGFSPFTTLSPRQAVTPAPLAYRAEEAHYAGTASTAANALSLGGQLPAFYRDVSNFNTGTLPSARLSGTYSQSVGFTNPGNAFSGSGAGLTGLNANNFVSGILPAVRGGTGSSISSANTGDVLKWNGTAFTAQPERAYAAGAGLALSGSTFSVAPSSIGSGLLAMDAASLAKVSGGAMQTNGQNVTFAGTISIPTTTRTLIIPPAAFSGSPDAVVQATRVGVPFGGWVDISAPISLPTGARITRIAVYGREAQTSYGIDVTVTHFDITTGASTYPVSANLQGQGFQQELQFDANGLDLVVTPTSYFVINANWVTYVNSPQWGTYIKGVRVDYTIDSVLP
jgi:hypothetical protein